MSFLCILIIFTVSVSLNNLVAQTTDDPCGCNAVLMHGVYSYRSLNGDTEATREVERYIARLSYEEFKKTQNSGGGGSYAGYGLDYQTGKEEFEKKRDELRSKHRDYSYSSTSRQILERFGDRNVLRAWNDCKRSCDVSGITSWVEVNDIDNFILNIQWQPFPGTSKAEVIGSRITDARVLRDGVAAGKVTPKNFSFTTGVSKFPIYRKNSKRPVVITINIDGMDVVEFIPKHIPSKQWSERIPGNFFDLKGKGNKNPYVAKYRTKITLVVDGVRTGSVGGNIGIKIGGKHPKGTAANYRGKKVTLVGIAEKGQKWSAEGDFDTSPYPEIEVYYQELR